MSCSSISVYLVWKLTTFRSVTLGVQVQYCPFRLEGGRQGAWAAYHRKQAAVPRAGQAPLKTAGEKSVPGFTPPRTRLTISATELANR